MASESPLPRIKKAKLKEILINNNKFNKLKKIEDTGRYFSKIASSYQFKNDTTSYLDWVIRFEAEMNNNNLDDVLITNPDSMDTTNNKSINFIESKERQKSVYHMIVKCVHL